MRKIFNMLLSILTVVYIGFVGFYSLNAHFGWADLTSAIVSRVLNYGGYALLLFFGVANLFGKGVLRIIFFILLILVTVLFVIVNFFPSVITSIGA